MPTRRRPARRQRLDQPVEHLAAGGDGDDLDRLAPRRPRRGRDHLPVEHRAGRAASGCGPGPGSGPRPRARPCPRSSAGAGCGRRPAGWRCRGGRRVGSLLAAKSSLIASPSASGSWTSPSRKTPASSGAMPKPRDLNAAVDAHLGGGDAAGLDVEADDALVLARSSGCVSGCLLACVRDLDGMGGPGLVIGPAKCETSIGASGARLERCAAAVRRRSAGARCGVRSLSR